MWNSETMPSAVAVAKHYSSNPLFNEILSGVRLLYLKSLCQYFISFAPQIKQREASKYNVVS